MPIHFDLRGDWEKASRLEWLEANGLGGYASSTACGANTRRYHGLLVPATSPPVGRIVLLSKLDERLVIGDGSFDLGCNQYPGTVFPRGFEMLDAFERDLFPSFDYSFADVRLRKTIAAIHGENTTVVTYELLAAPAPVSLELRPFLAARDYHGLAAANDFIRRDARFDAGIFSLQPYNGTPTLFLSVLGSVFTSAPDWYYRFEYAREQERGLDFHEDLFTPGFFRMTLAQGSRCAVIASTENPCGRDAFDMIDAERRRREDVIRSSGLGESVGRMGRALALAADQFIVRRGVDRKTIIAGYHWFCDWGRDTMIALPGLCLATRRFDDARAILVAFAESVSEGMLPNRFPDSGEAPEYNTADATLWFFVAAQNYLERSGDEAFVRDTLLPILRDIIAWHERGTRHNIHEDSDGLLVAGHPGVQLTWMDAKVGDWVVTPRIGKPVEINALWYNALRILSSLESRFGSKEAAQGLAERAARSLASFRKLFWNAAEACLFDVIDGDTRDASLRPNQIFAISLPYPLIEGAAAEKVLSAVEKSLLTPPGLRSLSPDDPHYVPAYEGGPLQRDGAYHQGTVWSWLLGPYITALVRVRAEAGIAEGRRILAGLQAHIEEACVGSISEIFDGAPPHHARGCIAQAWSVGEVIRAMAELGVQADELASS
ncbi:MAG TPA: amylo-alpha-1,6-glucosidase [Thermoanaerobaculia bacterium]|nr:amylo-alpha-1,6-glucosidase [Thermoanaerobaculia bacterium]